MEASVSLSKRNAGIFKAKMRLKQVLIILSLESVCRIVDTSPQSFLCNFLLSCCGDLNQG